MNNLLALSAIIDITNAALTLLSKAQEVGALVAKAQAENRDITSEELDSVVKEDDPIRTALNAAILKSRG